MDDAAKFASIFGRHERRATYGGRLRIRDDGFIADLKARVSGIAARDNRERGAGWLIEFSPTQTDDLTERSLFHATLASPTLGERRMSFEVGRDWVEVVGAAMESSVRGNADYVQQALERAFRRVAVREVPRRVDPAEVRSVTA